MGVVNPGGSPAELGWLVGGRADISSSLSTLQLRGHLATAAESFYEYDSEKGKEEGERRGENKAKEKRKRIKPLICLDFPLHRVISLEVTEIKWIV